MPRAKPGTTGTQLGANAPSLTFQESDQVASMGHIFGEIPGDSPISTCDDDDTDSDLLTIQSLVIDPNPPARAQNLTITAEGELKEDIAKGAFVQVDVKYGLIRLLRTTLDLCEQTEKVDLACPIAKGPRKITKTVQLPAQIPPGRYTVNAVALTEDERRITCLTARVQFH
ncbi:Phosphatidylglycerol/phosphatidylinositol transfer protein [Savitreella phatthalungensis]